MHKVTFMTEFQMYKLSKHELHIMLKNLINTLQVTCCISVIKISLLILLREIICLLIDVCMSVDKLGEQNAEPWYLNAGCVHSNCCAFKNYTCLPSFQMYYPFSILLSFSLISLLSITQCKIM
jgi:hypothetical protein